MAAASDLVRDVTVGLSQPNAKEEVEAGIRFESNAAESANAYDQNWRSSCQ